MIAMTTVDRVERDEVALDDVQAVLGLAQAELRAPHDDVEPMIDVVLAQVVEADAWWARPLTSTTLLMPKVSSSGVCL